MWADPEPSAHTHGRHGKRHVRCPSRLEMPKRDPICHSHVRRAARTPTIPCSAGLKKQGTTHMVVNHGPYDPCVHPLEGCGLSRQPSGPCAPSRDGHLASRKQVQSVQNLSKPCPSHPRLDGKARFGRVLDARFKAWAGCGKIWCTHWYASLSA